MTFKRSLVKSAVKTLIIAFLLSVWCSNSHAYKVSKTSGGIEIKWSATSVMYFINPSGGPSASLSAIQASMHTWTSVSTSSFTFVYGGSTSSTAWGNNDGKNIVCFGSMGSTGALATNSKWYYVSTGRIIDSDIKFNTYYTYKTDGSADAYDVQNNATHEFGHSLSLSDLYSAADSTKTMYGYGSKGETKKRTLTQDDKDGITYLYPSAITTTTTTTTTSTSSTTTTSTSPTTTTSTTTFTTSTTTSTSATTTTTLPASEPLAITGWATSITSNLATLNGKINPKGEETSYYFEYGTTADYGSSTTNEIAGNERSEVLVSSDILGLSNNKTYHYRVVANNIKGSCYGTDRSFTTTIVYVEPDASCGGNTPCYSTIQEAIDATNSGGTIKIARESYDEDLILGLSGNLILEGGWNASFTARSFAARSSINTAITGTMTITSDTDGALLIETLIFGTEIALSTYTNSLGQTFVLVPAGTFTMGSPSNEPGRWSYEGPQHQVTLTQPFYMQTTEVTQAQWEAVMGSNPSDFSGCPTCPVETVGWSSVQSYITQMNLRGEGTYSLPTEAQWEYAARAGSITAFYNGEITETGNEYDPNLDAIGWYHYNSGLETNPVAQKTPNAWGLYDMSGNIMEWCQDWYGSYSSSAVTDPTGPSSSDYGRVVRGGAWNYTAKGCRSAFRTFSIYSPTRSIGFRLLRQP